MAWVDDIREAMLELGGEAPYNDLYESIKLLRNRRDIDLTDEWKATIRRTIEDHSRDSANFRGKHLFSKSRRGVWRVAEIDNDSIEKENNLSLSKKELRIEAFARNVGLVKKINEIYDGFCQVTGKKILDGKAGKINHVHHITFLCDGGEDSVDNMMSISPDWHAVSHSQLTRFDWDTLSFVIENERFPLKLNMHLKNR